MKSGNKKSAYSTPQNGTREMPSVKSNRRRASADNRSAQTSGTMNGITESGRVLRLATKNSEQSVHVNSSELGGSMLCIDIYTDVINLSRELKTPELALIRNVIATLGYSSQLSVEESRDVMQIVVEYNSAVPQNVLTSIRTLITALETTYSGPASRNEIDDQSSSDNEMLDLDLHSSEQTAQQSAGSPNDSLSQDAVLPASPSRTAELENTEDGVYERPLSLKGQRHIFLYKCRYNKLKSVINKYGCWDLRVSSLNEPWPCLLVYCAKSKEVWSSAFKQIKKLEKKSFLRRKISDSSHNVDLAELEGIVERYGHKYALSLVRLTE